MVALVVAHPGHELRVHGWVERSRPVAFVLTDGSGARGRSRLASTSRVLERAGATLGAIYGRFTDRDLYAALLARDTGLFVKLADELFVELARLDVELVAADALEGFNPVHDVCRLVVDAAVERAGRRGRVIENLAFSLEAALSAPESHSDVVRIELDEAAFARKLAAAKSYAELDDEVERALALEGTEVFRSEQLWPAPFAPRGGGDGVPHYERVGEQRRAEGVYEFVIRRHEHIDPIARALRDFARGTERVRSPS